MFKIDYIIFYEHISREWEGVVRLHEKLQSLGFSGVILPIHYGRALRVLLFQPKVVITPFLYQASNKQHLDYVNAYGDCSCIDLHSEQIIDESTKNMYGPRDEYAREVEHIVWGQSFAESLLANGVNKENIYITGSIRNDGMVLNTSSSNDKKQLLICSSFSNTFVDDKYIEIVLEQHDIDAVQYREKIKITKTMRDAYFCQVYEYCIENQDVEVTLRPHPYVELKTYEDVFLAINKINKLPINIKIVRNGSVHQAIAGADNVVCWQSSVLLDATIMGKKVALLEPFDIPEYMRVPFSIHFPRIKNLSDIDSISSGDCAKQDYIKWIYGEVDGLSCSRVAAVVQKLIKAGSGSKQSPKFLFIMKQLMRAMFVDTTILVMKKIGFLHKVMPIFNGVLEDDKFKLGLKRRAPESDEVKFELSEFGIKVKV